jgi:ParB-like chromosome segregation protein Spo0J
VPKRKPSSVATLEPPKMQIESVTIDSIHVDPSNVRTHPERNLATIKASLARFGQQKPIVIDANGIVRAGNGTLEAARALGWGSIDVVRTSLVGVDATAYAIADNRTAELAEWDDEALAAMLAQLQLEEFDIEEIGFSQEELDRLSPDFAPAGIEDQGRLDEKAKVKCPECGHEF